MRKTFTPGTSASDTAIGHIQHSKPVTNLKMKLHPGMQLCRKSEEDDTVVVVQEKRYGADASLAREMRAQMKKYLAGKRMSSKYWEQFFDAHQHMKDHRALSIARENHSEAEAMLVEASKS